MALIKSQIITQASGSVGGLTFSHAKGGLYVRARAIPVNTNTGFQQQVRAAMTASVTRWTSTLTQVQRDGWNNYGANTPTTNALGDVINLSGQAWYNAQNVVREQAITKIVGQLTNTTLVDDPPAIYNRGDFTTPFNLTFSVAAGFAIEIDPADAWANEDNAVMLIYMGLPQNAGRKFFNGPWRLMVGIEGNSVTPPPAVNSRPAGTINTLGFPIQQGQQVTVAVAVARADGRISTRRHIGPVSVIA